ncbi:hypothetical protein PVAND_015891 [Polypedilum vanderplanki]|uniref:Uncharacterized protein n=1 Tax=Polypedilum vanderplanki TaxID=319348 RepID=A0A9J6BEH4_POLVA|nr:hypothetical protein PVAND_015891 [Polypedilum vanderplanki]
MAFKFIIKLFFFVTIFITSISAYSLYQYQNDLPSNIEDDEAEEEFDSVLVVKTENLDAEKNNQQNFILKSLNELQKKISNLEENEAKLKNELKVTKNELKKKNQENHKIAIFNEEKENQITEHNYKSDLEGFWSIICKVSKGLLYKFLNFFGVRL